MSSLEPVAGQEMQWLNWLARTTTLPPPAQGSLGQLRQGWELGRLST